MDGDDAKGVPMVVSPRYRPSRLHREGLHGHCLDSRLHFPLGNPPRYAVGRSSVAGYPDYDDAAR